MRDTELNTSRKEAKKKTGISQALVYKVLRAKEFKDFKDKNRVNTRLGNGKRSTYTSVSRSVPPLEITVTTNGRQQPEELKRKCTNYTSIISSTPLIPYYVLSDKAFKDFKQTTGRPSGRVKSTDSNVVNGAKPTSSNVG